MFRASTANAESFRSQTRTAAKCCISFLIMLFVRVCCSGSCSCSYRYCYCYCYYWTAAYHDDDNDSCSYHSYSFPADHQPLLDRRLLPAYFKSGAGTTQSMFNT